MFKLGDKVVCIDSSLSREDLIEGKTYTVKYIDTTLNFIGFESNDNPCWFEYRFKLDLKYIRKQKIIKINKID